VRGAACIRRAIALLEEDAQIIFDSNVIKAKGHPRCGTFDTDEAGLLAKSDYEARSNAAAGLRKLIEKGST
jgi:hypothetical protein